MARLSFAWVMACLGAVALAAACSVTTNAAPPGAGGPGSSGGDPGSSGGDGVTGNLPCDVDAVLANNCRKCHAASPQFGAPMPLMTLADLHAPAHSDPSKKVYELVPLRIADDDAPMPPPPNARLATADRDTLSNWAGAGAPAGADTCASTAPPPVVPPLSCTPDLEIAPPTPWTQSDQPGDTYVCYGVDVTRADPTHAVGFTPHIDNTKIVHHILLFETDSTYPATPQACDGGISLQWRMVFGWAPGAKGFELPPEAGFPLATTGDATHFVVQVHYSNPQGLTGQTDSSGFSVCTAPPRPNEADVMAFGTQSFTIPPGNYSRTCTVKVPTQTAGLHLIAAMPHMHKLGTSIVTTLTPAAGGPDVDLGADPTFSFNNQAWMNVSATTAENDVITTTCKWANTTGADVKYGETTADEMCYSFTVYYPKVQSQLWSWALPALTSSCQ